MPKIQSALKPRHDSGRHQWIFDSAKFLVKKSQWSDEQIENWIRSRLNRPEHHRREIAHAISQCRGYTYAGNGDRPATPTFKSYDPDKLAEVASSVPFEVTDDWLAEVSPECVLNATTAQFLAAIYRPGESVWVGEADEFQAIL